jgi:hypothetical protein
MTGVANSKPMTVERFMRHVQELDNGCWRWTAAVKPNGYGITPASGRMWQAHRAAYDLFVGPIPDGLHIDHLCHGRDVSCAGGWGCEHRRCVNPDHLEAVSGRENLLRGRGFVAAQVARTHCPQGHAYDTENTGWNRGKRKCRACDRIRHALRKAAA